MTASSKGRSHYVAPSSSTLCGQAAGIATSNANAYFVMNPSCMTGNYTFVHEAGHVVGARHDNDSTTSPYAYGHGYVMSSINRRKITIDITDPEMVNRPEVPHGQGPSSLGRLAVGG